MQLYEYLNIFKELGNKKQKAGIGNYESSTSINCSHRLFHLVGGTHNSVLGMQANAKRV